MLNELYSVNFVSRPGRDKVCDEIISEIEDVFNNNAPEQVNKMLGGEFTLPGGSIQVGKVFIDCGLPLFAMLTLIEKSSHKIYNEGALNAESRLNDLINKAKQLDYNSAFKYDEQISNEAARQMSKAHTCHLSLNTEEDVRHLSISSTKIIDEITYVGGEPVPQGTKYVNSEYPLYESDYDEIQKIKWMKSNQKLQRLNDVAGKYFKSGKVPTHMAFNQELIDLQLDERISSILFSISLIKDKNVFSDLAVADKSVSKIEELERIEQVIMQERKMNSIEKAKQRYKEKSFFWKLFNKKLNPEKQNFESMDVNEIDELYVGKAR